MNKYSVLLSILIICLLFSGCEKPTDLNPESQTGFSESESADTVDYEAEYRKQEKNDLFAGNWKKGELTNAKQFMAFTDYIPEVFPRKEQGSRVHRGDWADGDNMYSLDTCYTLEEDGLYHDTHYLYILDGITRQVSTVTYKAEEGILGLMMMGPYQAGGRIFASSFGTDEEGMLNSYSMVELFQDGTVKQMQELYPVVAQMHMLPDSYNVPDARLYYEPANDRYYLISPDNDRLYLIDSEGKLINGAEEKDATDLYLLAGTPEGRLIFAREDGETCTCFFYDGEEKQVLFSGEGPVGGIGASMVDGHGRMLFVNKMSVIEWDTVAGTLQRLYVDSTMDEAYNYEYIDCVMRNRSGEVLTLRKNNLRVLSMKGPAEKADIQIKPLLYFGDELKRAVRKYEQTHPGVTITIQKNSEWASRDRDIIALMQEMAEGSGPDLLLLDRYQMLSFHEKDCLMDLSEMLVPSTKEQLIPGVLDYGRTENGIMLLSCRPLIRTAFVNRKYLKNGSWTAQDMVNIIEEREKEGRPFELLTRGDYIPLLLFLENLTDSEFLNLREGTCSFDSALFAKVLEICKQYNKVPDYNVSAYEQLIADEILTVTPTGMGLMDYSEACAVLGEDFVTGGYPSLSGNGSHLEFTMGFAVNKNTENYEVIADFMNYFFSLENEALYGQAPVRKDLYESRIVVPDGSDLTSWHNSPYIRLPGSGEWPLAAKPDGSSYVNEFLDFVEKCRYDAGREMADDITRIIVEESDGYFEGDGRSAEEVAKIIQSRVSLYLKENR